MERYNIFNLIHKGLRAALYHTALQLQQTDFTEENQAEETVNKVKEIVMLFEGHAQKEDAHLLPVIGEYEPSVVVSFNNEHTEDKKLGIELNNSVKRVEDSTSLLEKIVSGRALTEAFVRFMVFNLNHMAKEENILNKILWRYFSDDDIKEISKKISRDIAPWIQDFYATWILRGINNSEATAWMKTVQKTMPSIVFQTLLQKAEQELPQKRFQKITQPLTEGLQLA